MGSPYRVIRAPLASGVDEYAIDEHDIIADPTTGLPAVTWSNLGTVVNKVDVSYDFNEPTKLNDYSRRRFYTAETSVNRYTAQPPLTGTFRGIHTSLGGSAILDRLALLYLQRWGYPPPILIFSVTYRRHVFEALDTIRITHAKIANCLDGTMGLTNELFEILSVNPVWGLQGRLDIQAVWIGAIERSAVPVSGGTLSLVPGESTVDATDTNIPFGTSITLTTPGAACTQIRVGLKSLSYRTWQCFYDDYILNNPTKDTSPVCNVFLGNFFDRQTFNTTVTYHMDYKKSTAPDAPGGGNPANGWVELLASSERGNTSRTGYDTCGDPATLPAEDIWTHFFGTVDEPLLGVPSIFNVKIFFDAITTAGDPCTGAHANCGGLAPVGCFSQLTASNLEADVQRMTADFIEAIV
jgi:hypothetical protein